MPPLILCLVSTHVQSAVLPQSYPHTLLSFSGHICGPLPVHSPPLLLCRLKTLNPSLPSKLHGSQRYPPTGPTCSKGSHLPACPSSLHGGTLTASHLPPPSGSCPGPASGPPFPGALTCSLGGDPTPNSLPCAVLVAFLQMLDHYLLSCPLPVFSLTHTVLSYETWTVSKKHS